MHPNWIGVLAAALSLAAFPPAYRLAARLDARGRRLFAAGASLAALPGLSFAAHYAHVLPETGWYYQLRSLTGTELLVVLVGVAGGAVAALLPRRWLAPALAGIVALSIAPFAKPLIGPLPDGVLRDEWNGAVCLQSTQSTCGAASVATLLRANGVAAREADLAREAHSYQGGTEAWYLARAIRARDCRVRFPFAHGFDDDVALPAMAGVRMRTYGHFIPILARNADGFVIGDPLRGEERLTREALLARYDFTGFYMVVDDCGRGPRTAF